ncbi:MAG: hypothetical protein ACJ8C4_01245 [Gemmataceae bacterium]
MIPRLNISRRSRWQFRPLVERCEARITPATATLSSGVLTVNFTNAGSVAESVTLTDDGTNITLTGNVSGATSNPVGNVNTIVLQDTAGGTTQSATFTGSTPFALKGGLSSAGIETATFSTAITTLGTLSLTGSGQMATFSATGNHAIQLAVGAGVTALVNGSFDATSFVQVDGTLGGKGSVGTVTVTNTGRIAPGNSTNRLTTGNVVFNSGSVFDFKAGGVNAGVDQEQLAITGTVDLGGATLQASFNYFPGSKQAFKIIDNDGSDAITGTFNGYTEGATVTIAGQNFTLSYQGGDGNDVTLTAPPPPSVQSVILDEGTGNRTLMASTARPSVPWCDGFALSSLSR